MAQELSGTYEELVRALLPRMAAPHGAAQIEICGQFVRALAIPLVAQPGTGGLSMRMGRFAIRKDDVPVFDTVLTALVAATSAGPMVSESGLSRAAVGIAAAMFRLLHSLRSNGAWLDDAALRILTILQANVRAPADNGLTPDEILTIVQRVTPAATIESVTTELQRLAAWPVPSAANAALVSEANGRWRPHV